MGGWLRAWLRCVGGGREDTRGKSEWVDGSVAECIPSGLAVRPDSRKVVLACWHQVAARPAFAKKRGGLSQRDSFHGCLSSPTPCVHLRPLTDGSEWRKSWGVRDRSLFWL